MQFITKIFGIMFLNVLLFSSTLYSGNIKSIKTKKQDVLLSTSLDVTSETKKTIDANLQSQTIALDIAPTTTGVLQSTTYMIPEIRLSIDSDNPYFKNDDFTIQIECIITLDFENSTEVLPDQVLNVDQDNPSSLLSFRIKEDIVKNNNLKRISVEVNSVQLTGNYSQQPYSLNLRYVLNYNLLPKIIGSQQSIVYIKDDNATKIINNNDFTPVYLNWEFDPNYDYLAERPHSYQLQLLKLHNIGDIDFASFEFNSFDLPPIEAKIDWDNAITFETGSELTYAWFFITDGSGYYIWRVRPIGNKYFGGAANSLNYGIWSYYNSYQNYSYTNIPMYDSGDPVSIQSSGDFENFHGFYYEQPESDKNWTFQQFYFEDLSDSTKLASTIGYADALLNPLQSQRYIYSEDQSIIQHNVLDYSAKPSIISLPVPVTTKFPTNASGSKAAISFKTGLLTSGSEEYSSPDFDQTTNYLNISPADGVITDYYSGMDYIPNSEGFPFSRAVDLGDEIISSMPGKIHRIDPHTQHNKRVYYSAISEDELHAVMGKERPVKAAIYKEIIIDENENISFVYKNKFGKTIATAIAPNSVNGLEYLNNDPIGAPASKDVSLDLYNPDNSGTIEINSTLQKYFTGVQYADIDFSVGNIPTFTFTDDCYSKTAYIPMKDAKLGYSKSLYGQSQNYELFSSLDFDTEFSRNMPFSRNFNSLTLPGDGNYTFYWNYTVDYSQIDEMRNDFTETLNSKFGLVFGELLDSIQYYQNMNIPVDDFYAECVNLHFTNWTIPAGEKVYVYGSEGDCLQFELPRLSCAGDVSEELYDFSADTLKWNNFEKYLFDRGQNLKYNFIEHDAYLLRNLSYYLYINGKKVYNSDDLNEYYTSYDERPHPINDLIYNMYKQKDQNEVTFYDPLDLAFAWQTLCDNYSTLAFKISNGKDNGIANTLIFNKKFDLIKEFLNITGRMYEGISNFTEIYSATTTPNYKTFGSSNLYGLDFVRFAYKYFWYSEDEYITREYKYNALIGRDVWHVPYGDWLIDFGDLYGSSPYEFEYPANYTTHLITNEFLKLVLDHPSTTTSNIFVDETIKIKKDVLGFIVKDENFADSKPWEAIYESQQAHVFLSGTSGSLGDQTGINDKRNRDLLGEDASLVDEELAKYESLDRDELQEYIRKREYLNEFYANVVRNAYINKDIYPEIADRKPDPNQRFLDITRLYDDIRMLADTVYSINTMVNAGKDLPGYATDIEVANQYKKLDTMVQRNEFRLVHKFDGICSNQDEQKFSKNKIPEVLLSHQGKYYSKAYKEKVLENLAHKLTNNLIDQGYITPDNKIQFNILFTEEIRRQNWEITVEHFRKFFRLQNEEINKLFGFPDDISIITFSPHGRYNSHSDVLLDFNTIAVSETGFSQLTDANGYSAFTLDLLRAYPYVFIPIGVDLTIDARDRFGNYIETIEIQASSAGKFVSESQTTILKNKYSWSPIDLTDVTSFSWYTQFYCDYGLNTFDTGLTSTFFYSEWFPYYDKKIDELDKPGNFLFYRKYLSINNIDNTSYGYCGNTPLFFMDYTEYEVDTRFDDAIVVKSPTCSDVLYEQLRAAIFDTFTHWKEGKLKKFDDALEEFKTIDLDYQPEYKIEYTEGVNQNFTLFFYDRSGNLIRSVPPAGVHYNLSNTENSTAEYSLETRYRYDGNNKLLVQKSPDEDEKSVLVYNDAGQLRFSISPNQIAKRSFSYIKYDQFGRVIESGEANETTDFEQLQKKADADFDARNFGVLQYPVGIDIASKTRTFYTVPFSKVDPTYPQKNISGRVSYVQKFEKRGGTDFIVTETAYSYDPMGNVEWIATAHFDYLPELQGRPWEYPQILSLINYTYDLSSGKVTMVDFKAQYNPFEQGGGTFPVYSLWQLQNVNKHRYIQKYKYDTDNRIIEVLSSMDSVTWESDARYHYYKHGPLQRTEYGEDLLQGVDYTYTIQGWLKGINNSIYKDSYSYAYSNYNAPLANDPGGDNNNEYLQDYFGTVLNYYDGDYLDNTNVFDRSSFSSAPVFNQYYNGNINSIEYGFNADALYGSRITQKINHSNKYSYDKLYRIKEYQNYEVGNAYKRYYQGGETSRYSYDPSGNISTLSRYAGGTKFDSLVYNYTPLTAGSSYKLSNKLDDVDEKVTTNQHGDLEFYNDEAYQYDAEGNLQTVTIAGSSFPPTNIEWDVNGKIKTIEFRIDLDAENCYFDDPDIDQIYGSYNCKIENFYDAAGNRICKCMTSEDLKTKIQNIYGDMGPLNPMTIKLAKKIGLWHKFYYYDANNLMLASFTMYNHCSDGQFYTQDAWYLYGSGGDGRVAVVIPYDSVTLPTTGPSSLPDQGEDLGFATKYKSLRQIGHKEYELTDHLGNVRLTFSDYRLKTTSYNSPRLKVLSRNNYFPFGMLMPDRFANEEDAKPRFGFNGMEREDEIAGLGNMYTAKFWEYDSRTARRWNLDPRSNPSISSYGTFALNPVKYSDVMGDSAFVYSLELDNQEEEDFVDHINDKSEHINFAIEGNRMTYEKEDGYTPNSWEQEIINAIDSQTDNVNIILTNDINFALDYAGEFRVLNTSMYGGVLQSPNGTDESFQFINTKAVKIGVRNQVIEEGTTEIHEFLEAWKALGYTGTRGEEAEYQYAHDESIALYPAALPIFQTSSGNKDGDENPIGAWMYTLGNGNSECVIKFINMDSVRIKQETSNGWESRITAQDQMDDIIRNGNR